MSWWTDFRDSALRSAGLKKPKQIGAAVGGAVSGASRHTEPVVAGVGNGTAVHPVNQKINLRDPRLWALVVGGYFVYQKFKDGN